MSTPLTTRIVEEYAAPRGAAAAGRRRHAAARGASGARGAAGLPDLAR